MNLDNVVRIEDGMLRRLVDAPGVKVVREEVVHLTVDGNTVVSIYPKEKHAEFAELYRDPTVHGPKLRPLMDYLRQEDYTTNLK